MQGLTEHIKLLTLALGNYFIFAKSLKVKKKLLLCSYISNNSLSFAGKCLLRGLETKGAKESKGEENL